jgi:putative ABC transport system substrate-binding protein
VTSTTRRGFIRRSALLGGAAVAAACAGPLARPASPPRVIGYLSVAGSHSVPYFEAFRRGLRDQGFIEGKDVTIEYRFSERHDDAELRGLATQLVDLGVDLILARCSPETRAAKAVTSTVPIVMIALTGDPIATGVVESLSRPNGNVTGLTILEPELSGKRIELIKEAFPGTRRVGVLLNVANPENQADVDQMRKAATNLDIALAVLSVRTTDELATAFDQARLAGVDAITTLMGSLGTAQRTQIVDLQRASRWPALYEFREFVEAGGIMSYGPSLRDLYYRAAGYAARILRGTLPSALPVERPGRFELVVSRKAASSLGFVLPDSILAQANVAVD